MKETPEPAGWIEEFIRSVDKHLSSFTEKIQDITFLKKYEKSLKKDIYKTVILSFLAGFAISKVSVTRRSKKRKENGTEK